MTSLDLTDCSVRMYNVECQYRCLNHAWTLTRENLTSLHANSKGVNQPVHPRILISAFVIRCFESMIAEVAMCEISIDTPCLSSIVWVVKMLKQSSENITHKGFAWHLIGDHRTDTPVKPIRR